MVLYHATDYKVTAKIEKDGFFCKPNKEHWLGNGIYFYRDYSLAEWWGTNPTNKFGTGISTPAVITCEIDESEHKILDLLRLEDYKIFCDEFEDIFLPLYSKYSDRKEIPDWKQVRCAFCDFMASVHKYDIIVGNFDKPDQPYQPKDTGELFKTFMLTYTEVQICVFDSRIIKIKNIDITKERG